MAVTAMPPLLTIARASGGRPGPKAVTPRDLGPAQMPRPHRPCQPRAVRPRPLAPYGLELQVDCHLERSWRTANCEGEPRKRSDQPQRL